MKITCIVLSRSPDIDIAHLQKAFDEVLVFVDSESTTSTLPHLRYRTFDGDFSAHRNAAVEHARNEWVFFLDEDETAPQALIDELHTLPKNIAGYKLPRQDRFMGEILKYGETGNIQLLRFANKQKGKWVRPVHEVWEVDGNTRSTRQAILHTPHNSLESFVEKLDQYTSIEANYRKSSGKRFSLIELLVFPLAKFMYNYVFRFGFLDGFPGLVMAYMMSLHSLMVRIKMYEPSKN